MVGGIAWIGLSVVYSRVLAGACARCGRGAGPRWTEPGAAARWGRWAVVVAVVIPLVYAATRWAWALGIPLGVTDEFLREGAGNGMWLAGAALGTIAVGGALLTTGLTLRWGERFPEWLHGPIRALPLTALVDALRATYNDGASLPSLWPQIAVLCAWGLVGFAIALRTFRWQ